MKVYVLKIDKKNKYKSKSVLMEISKNPGLDVVRFEMKDIAYNIPVEVFTGVLTPPQRSNK